MTSAAQAQPSTAAASHSLLLIVGGATAIVAGLLFMVEPAATATLLLVVLGTYWFVIGIVMAIGAIAHRDEGWGLKLAAGLCGVVAGGLIVLQPQIAAAVSLITLYVTLASASILFGAFEIGAGLFSSKKNFLEVGIGVLQIIIGILLFMWSTSGGVYLFVPLMGLATIATGVLLLRTGFSRRKSA